MKFTRNLSSRIVRCVSATLLACCSLTAGAQQSNTEESPMIITFGAAEAIPADRASEVLTKRLRLNSETDELRSAYIERPGDGLQVQRFNQYFKGVRVANGTYTLTSKNGIAAYAFGKFYPTHTLSSPNPQLDEAAALSKALAYMDAKTYAWENGSEAYPVGTLHYVEDFSGDEPDGILHLAYAFDIYAAVPERRELVYVDALSGKILLTDQILKHATVPVKGASLYSDTVSFNAEQIGSLYYLHDSTRGNGIYTYNAKNSTSIPANNLPMLASSPLQVTSSATIFARDPAVDAHWGATVVYDYWKGTHNRDSWDGNGGMLRSYVHYGTNYNNASWNGSRMQYGDGTGLPGGFPPLTSLDVCAHEMGHGICQSTAGLLYQRESGAMNEGFSDIWAAVIEAYGNPHETDAIAKNPWLIAEELTNTMRSMSNPKQHNQPDTYLGINWMDASSRCIPGPTNDNCGVHYNSGVLNHWFYLLSDGGKGVNDLNNAYNVTGIGMAKAAKIAYATELALSPTSNYAACRIASIAATTTMYGACSPELEAVTRAWYAVNVGSDFFPCVPQVTFNASTGSVSEDAMLNACRPSHTVTVPVSLNGTALTGDSAVVSLIVVGGTAVAGIDYDLLTPSVTFKVGGPTTQSIGLTVYDNGYSNANKYIDFTYNLSAGGSNATKAPTLDTMRVMIANDDNVPFAGVDEQRLVLLSRNAIANTHSPFLSSAAGAKFQYLYLADELLAAGVRPGVPLTAAEFDVMTKYSNFAFKNYTLKLANTSRKELGSGFVSTGFTTVFNGDVNTVIGPNQLPFSTPFVWNGTDHLAVEICFANDSTVTNNDRVQARTGMYFLSAMASSTGFGTDGCALPLTSNSLINTRPLIWFRQPTQIETALNATRTWELKNGQEIYFYSHGPKKLMAAVLQPSDSLGCVTTSVTAAGNGFKSSANGLQRSVKEFSITPGRQPGSIAFDGIFYFTNEELTDISRGRVKIVQTTSADDNGINASNTQVVTPSDIIYGLDYTAFRGSFNGFGRFFLDLGDALKIGAPVNVASEIWTGANPFTTAPTLHWNLQRAERVNIRLYDITGRLVYGTEQSLEAGQHQLTLSGGADLVPGSYVLQVLRPSGVFTSKMTKQ